MAIAVQPIGCNVPDLLQAVKRIAVQHLREVRFLSPAPLLKAPRCHGEGLFYVANAYRHRPIGASPERCLTAMGNTRKVTVASLDALVCVILQRPVESSRSEQERTLIHHLKEA